jgi:hypothetical protein
LKIYFSEEEVQSVIFAIQTWNIKAGLVQQFLADQPHNNIMTGKVMLLILKLAKSKTPFNHIHWVHSLLKLLS